MFSANRSNENAFEEEDTLPSKRFLFGRFANNYQPTDLFAIKEAQVLNLSQTIDSLLMGVRALH